MDTPPPSPPLPRVSGRRPLGGVPGLFALGLLALGACGESGPDTERLNQNASAETLYNYGLDALRSGRYKLAGAEFGRLERDYPYSGHTGNAELMAGYAFYLHRDYAPSVRQLERYLQLHPTSPDAPYAYYLRALCYYEQIAPVERDQLATAEAMDALQEVITRFPQTSYARDARLKIDLCRDHLAGKELLVGRFYQRQKSYQAAIGRYQRVVQDFQTTNHVPEALERLVEIDLDLGLPNEAHQAAAVLGYNYPSSHWYRLAYDRLKAHHALNEEDLKHARDYYAGSQGLDAHPAPDSRSQVDSHPLDALDAKPKRPEAASQDKSDYPDSDASCPPDRAKLPTKGALLPIKEHRSRLGRKKRGAVGTVGHAMDKAVDWFFDLGPLPAPGEQAARPTPPKSR